MKRIASTDGMGVTQTSMGIPMSIPTLTLTPMLTLILLVQANPKKQRSLPTKPRDGSTVVKILQSFKVPCTPTRMEMDHPSQRICQTLKTE
jgi:hypothetical protein